MLISDLVFNRMKELKLQNGVFLFVSNNKQSLRDEAPSFAHSLLDYKVQDVPLNEKIYVTDGENISVDMVNDFIEFESKKAVNVPSKILIMHDVELLKDNISDKLLKCIEDYNSDSLIILTTTSLESVSRTIKSRCMVFKEYTDIEQYFVNFRNKYLSFMDKVKERDYYSLAETIQNMANLGSINVIHAMFVNLTEENLLVIAKNALDAYLTGSKDEQVNSYIVYSVWCALNNLRRWDFDFSNSRQ